MKNDVIIEVNETQPVGVRRWKIVDDGTMKSLDKDGNVVDKQHYAIVTSRGGALSSALGELTKDEMIELAIVLDRFINNRY